MVDAIGTKAAVVAGMLTNALAPWILSTVAAGSGYATVVAALAVIGVGQGPAMAPATTSIMGSWHLPGKADGDPPRRVPHQAEVAALGGFGYRATAMDRAAAIDLLRRLHATQGVFYAGGEEAPVRALLTDDVHWHVPGGNAIAGDYHGIEAVLAYFRRRRNLVDRTLRLHPGEVLVGDGDHMAALTDGTAVVGGVQRRWSTVGLYQVRAGQVAACWLLPLDPDTFDDVWAGPR